MLCFHAGNATPSEDPGSLLLKRKGNGLTAMPKCAGTFAEFPSFPVKQCSRYAGSGRVVVRTLDFNKLPFSLVQDSWRKTPWHAFGPRPDHQCDAGRFPPESHPAACATCRQHAKTVPVRAPSGLARHSNLAQACINHTVFTCILTLPGPVLPRPSENGQGACPQNTFCKPAPAC